MSSDKFVLSEKRLRHVLPHESYAFYKEEYVKEFIKRLKEEINLYEERSQEYWIAIETIIEKIDKLAGEKLR